MNITFTLEEATEILRQKYNLSADCIINIGTEITAPHWINYKAAMRKFPGLVNKISAIKELRDLCRDLSGRTIGLAEAKYAVEAGEVRVKNYIAKHGTLYGFSENS